MRLRLASYNIHAGVGSDKRFNPQRLAAVLRRLDADLIGLQEVVSVGPDGFALLDELALACGMQAIAGTTMMRGDASYGNALLTRLPVQNIRRLELDKTRYEPRGALSVELGHASPLTVAVTHLGLHKQERRAQIEQLLAWLPLPPAPLVLLGDFNEWFPWSDNLRQLQRRFAPRYCARPTFPARLPLLALDRIFASPPAILRSVKRDTKRLNRKASDHLPLVADIHLPE